MKNNLNMKKVFLFLALFAVSLNLIGCLTVETKEYSFKLRKGNSGEGKIKYINIMRTIDSAGTIEADYDELINSYLKGTMPENEMMGVKNVKKRLFEEDNHLCGEITFEFDDIKTLKFYNYKNLVWGYHLSANSFGMLGGTEQFFSSNGTYGEANMPVIFWEADEKEFKFKTVMSKTESKTESLLGMWKEKGDK
jgi:hypothetical protein